MSAAERIADIIFQRLADFSEIGQARMHRAASAIVTARAGASSGHI